MDLGLTEQQQAFIEEAQSWLEEHYTDPGEFADFEAEIAWGREWQKQLAEGRWVGMEWPEEYGGRGASPLETALFNMVYARFRAPQPVNRVGLSHAGPTLFAHGTEEQKRRYLPKILTAEEIWCQLFSEPDAGSDLSSLKMKAEPVEGGWLLNGQKVWTSYAQQSKWGLCLARTDQDQPRARGISCLIVDMEDPGVTIRPLIQMTGEAEFSEVFLDDVFVPVERLVGEENRGWKVASTTLAYERGVNFPVKEQVVHENHFDRLIRRAVEEELLDDDAVAEEIAESYVRLRLLAWANLRTLTRLSKGIEPGPESSWIKLQWSGLTQQLSHVAVDLFGDDDAAWRRQYLWSRAASVAGGTSEIQKTILGERLLGLPRG